MRAPRIKTRQRLEIEILESRQLLSATLTTLASFPSFGLAQGGIVVNAKGDLFGTTQATSSALGTLYELPAGSDTISTLVTFTGGNGSAPGPGLLIDSAGNVFGVCTTGGAYNHGTIFELPAGQSTVTTLASYTGADGDSLGNGLVRDGAGNFYVIAQPGAAGSGAVLELQAGGNSFLKLATFSAGITPVGRLAIDSTGNLYGTTSFGGANNQGSIYELSADRTSFTTIASFDFTNFAPQGDLIADANGDLFGTSFNGGPDNQFVSTVFELPAGSSTLTTLANTITVDGSHIQPGLMRDSAGNLFGAMDQTGSESTVFEIPATSTGFGRLTTVASVPQINSVGVNVNNATGYLGLDVNGNLFGTTVATAAGNRDTIFEIPGAAAPDSASHLMVAQQPSKTVISTTIAPPVTVLLLDSNGNLVTTDNSAVTVRISAGPAGAVLGGTLTANVVNGVATFSDLSIDKLGNYTLTFSDGLLTATSTAQFKIVPSPLDGSHLAFTRQPMTALAGKKLDPFVVTAELPSNAVSTTTKGKVTLTVISPTGAKIYGVATAQLKKGVATFSRISFKTAGTYVLEASTLPSIPVESQTFVVMPAAAKKMVFSQQPANKITAGSPFSVSLELIDKFGNLVSMGDESTVSLILGAGARKTSLAGVLTVENTGGIATFQSLSLPVRGNYTIKAIDGADSLKATSKRFRVV